MNFAFLLACATCYGAPDAGQTRGQNWAIFTLLVITVFVLSGFAAMMVHLARRARCCQLAEEALAQMTDRISEAG